MHPFHHPPDPQTTALESHILDNKLSWEQSFSRISHQETDSV
jgi:hypothetical protein